MRVISKPTLVSHWTKYRNAESALKLWFKTALAANWTRWTDVRKTYNDADQYIRNGRHYLIFNIHHNTYRLIVGVNYVAKTLYIKGFMTHKVYSKNAWKAKL